MFDKRLIKNFDFSILIIITLLVCMGLIGIGIATRAPFEDTEGAISDAIGNFNLKQVKLQLVWFATGLVILLITVSIDYHIFSDLSVYLYWVVVGLLIIVMVAGSTGGGAQRWIAIGPFKLQPSEFAKLALILSLARIMSKREEKGLNNISSLIPIVLTIAILFVLIFKQPDAGTSLALIVILFGMIFVAGISYKLLFAGLTLGLAAIPAAWFFVLDDFQKNRILVFLNPGHDPLGKGYNVLQSMMSIGSGQLTGQLGTDGGLLFGNTLSQLDFLPAKETDFIFSVTTEALGFIGGIAIIVLYFLLIMRTIRIAVKARDTLGALIAVGVASMTLFHVFENIGMTMGIMPVTGLPLPFMSYGGSSMWTNMIAFGLVLNVGMRRHKLKF